MQGQRAAAALRARHDHLDAARGEHPWGCARDLGRDRLLHAAHQQADAGPSTPPRGDFARQRLGRRQVPLTLLLDVPVVFRAFDVLRAAGHDLLDATLATRKKALEELPTDGTIARVEHEVAGDHAAVCRLVAAAEGSSRVYLKDPESSYTPGRRGGPWRRLALTRR